MKFKILVINLLFFGSSIYSQDTIKTSPSINYSSLDWPIRGKNFVSQIEYGIEEIIFNDTQKRIEHCFYYDLERICNGSTYTLKNDSTLIIEDSIDGQNYREIWSFEKVKIGEFKVWREYDGIIESGYASKLIPLIKKGKYTFTDKNKSKTLWITQYKYNNRKKYYFPENYIYTKQKVKGKILEINQLDTLPSFKNGNPLPLELPYCQIPCISSPFYQIESISFIIDKYGNILNIRQENGSYDMQHCPFTVMEIMKQVNNFGELKPGVKNNKPVNTKYIVKLVEK